MQILICGVAMRCVPSLINLYCFDEPYFMLVQLSQKQLKRNVLKRRQKYVVKYMNTSLLRVSAELRARVVFPNVYKTKN